MGHDSVLNIFGYSVSSRRSRPACLKNTKKWSTWRRLALAGRRQDVQLFVRRLARRVRAIRPDVAEQLEALLAESPSRQSPLRNEAIDAVPVDGDSRLKLLRVDNPVVLETDPILADDIRDTLNQFVQERQSERALLKEGLTPAKSVLFTGPPGVGKSLTAKWLASRLDRPLLTLDLSAVMSSFLGKTGTNVRHVLDYAKNIQCVLFLDEIDAVAKRRDDMAEIGELKRLVTVLLQEIDDWPPTGVLVAATNHPDLLDPAAWRRFDLIIEFPMPTAQQLRESIDRMFEGKGVDDAIRAIAVVAYAGMSFSDIDRELRRACRAAVVGGQSVIETVRRFIAARVHGLPLEDRKRAAQQLIEAGLGQRQVHEWTGVHRDTIRKFNTEKVSGNEAAN